MNPFLYSPIARRLPALPWRRSCAAVTGRCQPGLRRALGAALLAAGVAHAPAQALDLNDATAQQLEAIRGIGPRTAQMIVSERERAGRFESLQDLAERVRGISQKKAEALGAAGLTVGEAGSASKAADGMAKPAGARPVGHPPAAAAAVKPPVAAKAAGATRAGGLAAARPRP
ncbi:ComEA family DNA-binding protein [Achromobacter ruhlandii]|uniref:ComEA family DNA-binding protein n=1 Tax=Achromobacter ruhlandii TaxID=72557 RepID=UPI0009ED9680|nr:DUF655 domain-containing protein [Achromobacter ruhlandii]